MSNDYDLPIGLVYERGDGTSDDTYFENSVMFGIYWDMEILVEYTKTAIIRYFKDVGAQRYLRRNPQLRSDIVTNNARQEFGVKMTQGKGGFKSLVNKLLKLEVKDNVHKIYLDKILLDLIDYGDTNTDIAMAYGVVLIHKLDIFEYISDDIDAPAEDDILMNMEFYSVGQGGRLTANSYGEDIELETFDPRKHLKGEEQQAYISHMEEKQKRIDAHKAKQQQINEDRHEDVFMKSILEEIERKKTLHNGK